MKIKQKKKYLGRPKSKADRLRVVEGVSECYCIKCSQWLDISKFYKDKNISTGLKSYCKTCQKKSMSSSEGLADRRERARKRKTANPERCMWYAAKDRAKRFKIPFSIKVSDISIPKYCPIFGIKLEYGDKTTTNSSPSLDKVIPALGYIPGNVAVISYSANRLKRDASLEDMKRIVRYMTKYTNVRNPKVVNSKPRKMAVKINK